MNPNARLGLVGFQVVAARPVGRVLLTLQPGLTAVYGKNGVGKTRFLSSLARVLNPESYLEPHQDESAGGPTNLAGRRTASPTAMAYLSSAIHYRWPLTRALWEDPTESQPLINALAAATGAIAKRPQSNSPRSRDKPQTRCDWDDLLLYVMEQLQLDASIETVELLLERGHWMVGCEPGAPAFLCDPDPTGGPLAAQWALAADHWRHEFGEWVTANSQSHEQVDEFDESPGPFSSLRILADLEHPWHRPDTHPMIPPQPGFLDLADQPAWWTLPLAFVVALGDHNPVMSLLDEDSSEDVTSATVRALPAPSLLSKFDEPHFRSAFMKSLSDSVIPKLQQYRATANRLLAQLFEEPPLLSPRVTSPAQWFVGGPSVKWTASVEPDGPELDLSGLGSAHGRYSRFAIHRALRRQASSGFMGHHPGISFCVIDEPEAALHPSAQRHLAGGLSALADYVIVTTHSNEIIDASDHIVHATRPAGSSLVLAPLSVELTPSQRTLEARRLGQTPASLASLTKVVLLTEGAMDAKVLAAFLAPELASCKALLLPLHGTRDVPGLVAMDYLVHATDAPIVVALDNADAKFLSDLKRRLLTAGTVERPQLIDRALRSEDARRSAETKKLVALLAAASEANRLARFEVFGFRKHDIVEYLPVSLFKPGAESWDRLWNDFRSAHPEAVGPGAGQRFKTYVGPSYSVRGVAAAIDRMHLGLKAGQSLSSTRPVEFTRLANLLTRAARER